MYFYSKITPLLIILIAFIYAAFRSDASGDGVFGIFLFFGFLSSATYYKLENRVLYKYLLGVKVRTMAISDIELIEIVTVNQVTTFTIRIGKQSKYDGFYLNMKGGARYKLYRDNTNNENIELGMYLIDKMQVRSRKTEKNRLFSGRL